MRNVFFICLILPAFAALSAQTPNDTEEQRLRIIRYGTDTEIANLIRVLRNEQQSTPARTAAPENTIDRELLAVAEKSRNRAILSGIFGYFGDQEIGGLEQRAITAIEERDYEAAETVNAALLYLGKVHAAGIRPLLTDIMDGEETRFLSGAIRALGQTAEKDGPAETAEYLVDYYNNRDLGDENRRLIIAALGDVKAKEGTSLLAAMAENEDERVPLRMVALGALAKIADPEGLSAIISAASSRDPNVRSSAVAALGPYSGENADATIIDAFRDSYYRTRIAAAKAAGERKLAAAVPFLRFRSETDDVPTVRDEAIKALGQIGGSDAGTILNDLFKERRNSDRVRINAAEMLLTHSNDDFVNAVIAEMDEARAKNQNALYNGFLRILGSAKSPKLEDLARRFFAGGGVIEKSYALDICSNNEFRGLANDIRQLAADPRNTSLARKATALLERWELPLAADEESSAEESAAEQDEDVPG